MSRNHVRRVASAVRLFLPIVGLTMALNESAERAYAIVSRPILKSFFQTGDKPTQPQFATLIDSVLQANLDFGPSADQHGIGLDHGRIAIDVNTGRVRIYAAGERIDNLENFGGLGDNVTFNPIATAGTQDVATGGEYIDSDGAHFGFLQMHMDPPGSATPYAIHLDYFVYEERPGIGITTFFQTVPEPGTCTLVMASAPVILGRRRRR